MNQETLVKSENYQSAQAVNRGSAHNLMIYDANKKSIMLAYILWIFLAYFGAHRFYTKNIGSAIAQLLLTITGWILLFVGGIGFIILLPLSIWLLVDAFLIPRWIRSHNNLLIAQLNAN